MARVLVCDDEEAMRRFMARAMAALDHEVHEAADGVQALETIRREGAFDLVVTDIRMPAMDGIVLALNLARDHPGTAIILATGYAEQRERAADLKALVFGVLSKPFSLEELTSMATRALAR